MAVHQQKMTNQAYQMPTVITSQPMSTTTIIHQQVVHEGNNWSSGICDCFNDLHTCCCVFWCQNFYFACMATRMNENCCVGCSGEPGGCVPNGHLAMRSRFRGTHNIKGDICGDCCMIFWCKPCVMCQLAREMNQLGYPNNGC